MKISSRNLIVKDIKANPKYIYMKIKRIKNEYIYEKWFFFKKQRMKPKIMYEFG